MRIRLVVSAACALLVQALVVVPSSLASPAVRQPASPHAEFLGASGPVYFDVSAPLRDLARATGVSTAGPLFALPAEPGAALGPQGGDFLVQGSTGLAAMPRTIANFDGPTNLCSCLPPAPSMDVGLHHVFVTTNTYFTIYDKIGTPLLGPLPNNTLWAGFGGPCQTNNIGYPIVLYDQLADRWLVSQSSSLTAPFGLCVAMSVTGDPTGPWYRWSFSTESYYPDELKWGLWPDAYYASTVEWLNASSFSGIGTYAFDRAAMLAGNPTPVQIKFLTPYGSSPYLVGEGLLPADLDGNVPPPAGSPAIFLGSMDDGAGLGAPLDGLTFWRFHADFASPALSTFTVVSVLQASGFDSIFPCVGQRGCIPQFGTSAKLDFGNYRQPLQHRVTYRNFGTHQSVMANQSVEAVPGMAGIRWYELRNPHGTPTIHQQGTYAPGVSDGIHRWMGGLAMDNDGNMALGYNVSSATLYPGIRYTGRLATDPLGAMPQDEATIVSGTGSQTSTSSRWGEYSTMAVDPDDDCTFWYVSEYVPVTSTIGWRTRVASFKFSTCTPPVGVEEGASPPARTELLVTGPSRGRASIVFSLEGGADRRVVLDVFDVGGRRVRRLVDAVYSGGRYNAVWDASNDAGESVGPGVYFARLRAGEASDTGTILLLR